MTPWALAARASREQQYPEEEEKRFHRESKKGVVRQGASARLRFRRPATDRGRAARAGNAGFEDTACVICSR